MQTVAVRRISLEQNKRKGTSFETNAATPRCERAAAAAQTPDRAAAFDNHMWPDLLDTAPQPAVKLRSKTKCAFREEDFAGDNTYDWLSSQPATAAWLPLSQEKHEHGFQTKTTLGSAK